MCLWRDIVRFMSLRGESYVSGARYCQIHVIERRLICV